jgi:EVE domain
MPLRYWIGTVSADHVTRGVEGGFAQIGHGKGGPLQKMADGDGFIYYSPKTSLTDGDRLQAFTAIGHIRGEAMYQVEISPDFKPWRRNVKYLKATQTPIKPLLDLLSFTAGRASWGFMFRRGHFEITGADFHLIASAMGLPDQIRQP